MGEWVVCVAAGCWLLAAGCWLLAAGCWLLDAVASKRLLILLALPFGRTRRTLTDSASSVEAEDCPAHWSRLRTLSPTMFLARTPSLLLKHRQWPACAKPSDIWPMLLSWCHGPYHTRCRPCTSAASKFPCSNAVRGPAPTLVCGLLAGDAAEWCGMPPSGGSQLCNTTPPQLGSLRQGLRHLRSPWHQTTASSLTSAIYQTTCAPPRRR